MSQKDFEISKILQNLGMKSESRPLTHGIWRLTILYSTTVPRSTSDLYYHFYNLKSELCNKVTLIPIMYSKARHPHQLVADGIAETVLLRRMVYH